jgi:predicted Zn-ribbon and HTH transcriptional regulator
MTLIGLAAHFRCEPSEILEDLQHIAKSVRPARELVMLPAECKYCHFIFRERQDRNRLGKPSKCPKCNSERILPPVYKIRAKKK